MESITWGGTISGAISVAGFRGDVAASAFVPDLTVNYLPILDVARGVAAGYQAQTQPSDLQDVDAAEVPPLDADCHGDATARAIATALSAVPTLPVNTFLTLPIGAAVAATRPVREALLAHGSLRGVVLDISGFNGTAPVGDLEYVLAQYRDNGALISVGGHGAAQPELTSIVRLKPSILRLGRDWVRGVDRSEAKRRAIEVIGQLAGQLDAWILAEGVSTTAELRALAGLAVPLAQGPLIGEAREFWPAVEVSAAAALPAPPTREGDGVLRSLLQQAYTTRNAMAATAVLPETTGYDVVVVVDEFQRPVSLLEQGDATAWEATEVLAVNVETSVADAVARAMVRPRATRFTPLVCTDAAGRFLGILRIERLMAHLAQR